MIPDEVGVQLHDRATRNLPLSEEEQGRLKQWYAEQDELEMKRLGLDKPEVDLSSYLQAEIEATLSRIKSLTEQIQDLSAQNQRLRQEVITLRREVARRVAIQLA